MDARLDLFGALGLDLGQVHFIRNAGGLASDDAIRSILLSQHLLGTNAIMVIHHTRCGLESFDEDVLRGELADTFGAPIPFRLGAFSNVVDDVRGTVVTLRESPFINGHEIRGFVLDVDNSSLREVHVA
jgi:carbonic anhydrase